MPALPTTSGNPPAHILMDPSEADFDTAPHTFIDSLSYLASALEWFHATSQYPLFWFNQSSFQTSPLYR